MVCDIYGTWVDLWYYWPCAVQCRALFMSDIYCTWYLWYESRSMVLMTMRSSMSYVVYWVISMVCEIYGTWYLWYVSRSIAVQCRICLWLWVISVVLSRSMVISMVRVQIYGDIWPCVVQCRPSVPCMSTVCSLVARCSSLSLPPYRHCHDKPHHSTSTFTASKTTWVSRYQTGKTVLDFSLPPSVGR